MRRRTEKTTGSGGKRRVSRKSGRSKLLPVRAVCRNCGTPTVGRYCHMCGQYLLAGADRRLRDIAADMLGSIFSLDGRIVRTAWYLVAFPGRLTREFHEGRIVRYVYPSKLFWFTTILFLALFVARAGDNILGLKTEESRTETAAQPAAEPERVAEEADGRNTAAAPEQTAAKGVLRDTHVRAAILDRLPWLMLAMVPLLALLARLFFWRRERSFSDYLVFSLHCNSFMFLLLAAVMAVDWIFPALGDWTGFLMLVLAAYLGVALWRVYGGRVVPLVLKTALMGLLYLILAFVIFLLYLIVLAIFIGKIDKFA